MTYRVINIAEGTSADGPGLRTSIYFAGCQHFCPGCHNPNSWDFSAGTDWSLDKLMSVIRYNHFPVTFSGGDPLYRAESLVELARQIRIYFNEHPQYLHPFETADGVLHPGMALWVYTGFKYEDIRDKEPYRSLLQYVDVLVDGPFIESEKPHGTNLRFRGSLNQRFILPSTGEELQF